MPTNASDILNGLLGVGPLAGNSSGNQPSNVGASEGTAVFSDILGLLTNPTTASGLGQGTAVDGDSQAPNTNDFGSVLSNELSGQFSSVWMLGRPGAVAGQPFTNAVSDNQQQAVNQLTNSAVGDILGKSDAKSVAADSKPSNPTAAVAPINLNVQKVLDSAPIELTPGTYKVLSADVSDNSLNLTLESSDQKQIQVSLPLDQLMASGATSNVSAKATAASLVGGNQRVNLNQAGETSQSLSAWFDKLNVSELRVEAINSDAANKGAQSLKLSFVDPAVTGSQPMEVVLPATEIRAFRIQNLSMRRGAISIKSDGSGSSSSGAELALPAQNQGGARVTMIMPKPVIKAAQLDLSGDFATFGQSQDNTTSSTANFSNQFSGVQTGQIQTGGEKIQYAPAQFTLPDKIDQTLVPNGRSLTLKIQPEHLGPARLSLHYGSEGLTARVTVDSPLAQTTLERSLDRLHEQLTQAGVKVDRLEVALSGGFTRDHLFHQQAQWQRPQTSFNQVQLGNYQAVEAVSSELAMPIRREYLNAQGVNLFA